MRTRWNRRLLYSLAVVLLWLGFVVEGSHALFSDQAVLAGNTLNTGTVDLQISNSQNPSSTTYADSRPGFTLNLAPGETDEHYFLLRNVSSSNVALDIIASDMIPNLDTADISQLASQTTIEFVPVDASGNPVGTAVQGNLQTIYSTNLPMGVSIPQGANQRFKMRTTLASSYSQQGKSISYDLQFNGLQHVP